MDLCRRVDEESVKRDFVILFIELMTNEYYNHIIEPAYIIVVSSTLEIYIGISYTYIIYFQIKTSPSGFSRISFGGLVTMFCWEGRRISLTPAWNKNLYLTRIRRLMAMMYIQTQIPIRIQMLYCLDCRALSRWRLRRLKIRIDICSFERIWINSTHV